MKSILSALILFTSSNLYAQNYEGQMRAMEYLNKKWVDEPRQREHEIRMQRNAPGNLWIGGQGQGNAVPQQSCGMRPKYSVLNGAYLGTFYACE